MELLIKRAQKGDEEAFIAVIDTLMPQMYKVAKARLKNEEDIGDAIQETILSAFANLKKVKEPVYFKTWITKILMNKCNDIVRKNKVLYVDDYGELQGEQIVKDNIEQELEFDNMLSYLSVEYRLVIVLHYVNKFKTKEIAEILNEKEGTIKSRLHRARQQLKEYYLKEDWENVNNGGNLK